MGANILSTLSISVDEYNGIVCTDCEVLFTTRLPGYRGIYTIHMPVKSYINV